jgi:hypothetical protein
MAKRYVQLVFSSGNIGGDASAFECIGEFDNETDENRYFQTAWCHANTVAVLTYDNQLGETPRTIIEAIPCNRLIKITLTEYSDKKCVKINSVRFA